MIDSNIDDVHREAADDTMLTAPITICSKMIVLQVSLEAILIDWSLLHSLN